MVTTAQIKRKLDSNEKVIVKKRGRQNALEPLIVHDDMIVEKEPVNEVLPARYNETSLALAEFRKESESRWNQYCGVNISTYSSEAGDKVAEQILQREIKHVDAMAKLQFEAEQKRQELHTKCVTALSRQKLRSAGFSEEDVNNMIPK